MDEFRVCVKPNLSSFKNQVHATLAPAFVSWLNILGSDARYIPRDKTPAFVVIIQT